MECERFCLDYYWGDIDCVPFSTTADFKHIALGDNRSTHEEIFNKYFDTEKRWIEDPSLKCKDFVHDFRIYYTHVDDTPAILTSWDTLTGSEIYTLKKEMEKEGVKDVDDWYYEFLIGQHNRFSYVCKISEYVTGRYDKFAEGQEDIEQLHNIHLLNSLKKRNTPQMVSARDERDKLNGEKFGIGDKYLGGNGREVPEAEYRFALGENVKISNKKLMNIMKESIFKVLKEEEYVNKIYVSNILKIMDEAYFLLGIFNEYLIINANDVKEYGERMSKMALKADKVAISNLNDLIEYSKETKEGINASNSIRGIKEIAYKYAKSIKNKVYRLAVYLDKNNEFTQKMDDMLKSIKNECNNILNF
jgi:hypothetical protein